MKIIRAFDLPTEEVTYVLDGPYKILGIEWPKVYVEVNESDFFRTDEPLRIKALRTEDSVPNGYKYIGTYNAVHFYQVAGR